MATKEFFPGIEKIKFEGKDSKNPMAFRYYDAEKVIILCVLKVATNSVVEQNNSLGIVMLTLYKLQKIKWTQVSNSCRKWVSNTTVSTM